MSFDICWYLAFASQIDDVDVRAPTDIQTHKTTTVTLAAHARRGLITSVDAGGSSLRELASEAAAVCAQLATHRQR